MDAPSETKLGGGGGGIRMLWVGLVSGCSVRELGVVVVGSGAIDQKLPPSTAG